MVTNLRTSKQDQGSQKIAAKYYGVEKLKTFKATDALVELIVKQKPSNKKNRRDIEVPSDISTTGGTTLL